MAYCMQCGRKLKDDFVFCPDCGEKITSDYIETYYDFNESKIKICKICGSEMPEDIFYCLKCGNIFNDRYNNFNAEIVKNTAQNGIWRNKWISLLLCIFLGFLGIHRFYEGKVITGILYLFTFGFLGIGWLADIVRISLKPNPYKSK